MSPNVGKQQKTRRKSECLHKTLDAAPIIKGKMENGLWRFGICTRG